MKKILLVISLLMMLPLIVYSANTSTPQPNNKQPSYWVDPMEPDVHYSAPGKSRMGMELVPVYPDQKNGTNNSSKE